MAMSVTYTTFCGQIVHENRAGVEHYYVPDTLGSTAALMDTAGNVTDTFEYWPYGEVRTRTGTTQTPFQFVGILGYYVDAASRLYVRARHYLANYARWLTVDPLWPMEQAFLYCIDAPVQRTDRLGLRSCDDDCDKGGDPCLNYFSKYGMPKFDDGSEKGGWVVCCKDKCYACVNWGIFDVGSDIYQCIRAHEKDHCTRQSCSGKPFGQPPYPPIGPDTDECMANDVELSCLKNALSRCKTEDCRAKIEGRIKDVCRYSSNFCPNSSYDAKMKNKTLCKAYGVTW